VILTRVSSPQNLSFGKFEEDLTLFFHTLSSKSIPPFQKFNARKDWHSTLEQDDD